MQLDLLDKRVTAMIEALAVIYSQLTGPYWHLMTSEVPYLEMHFYIQELEKYVTSCIKSPLSSTEPTDQPGDHQWCEGGT